MSGHADSSGKTIFGFWLYLLSDFVLFGTLFATYAVLHKNTFGGEGAGALFFLPYNLLEMLLILLAAFTAGLSGVYTYRKEKRKVLFWLIATFLLGALFLWMQLGEFMRLLNTGNPWTRSAFLSAYFTLVGTHAVHVVFALLFTLIFLLFLRKKEIGEVEVRRFHCLRMFWQFLSVVWTFIFAIVYLFGEATI